MTPHYLCLEILDEIEVINYIKKRYYFNILFDKLKLNLLGSDLLDLEKKNEINIISKYIIVEFILIGYNYKTIGKFINNILSGYIIQDDRIITYFFDVNSYNSYNLSQTLENITPEAIKQINSLMKRLP